MITRILNTFKINKEIYTIEYNEGIGIFGIEDCYISVKTPENCFGYPDIVLLGDMSSYTLHRYLPKYILKKIEVKMHEATIKYCNYGWKKCTIDYYNNKYGGLKK